jgi:hypothetical protein
MEVLISMMILSAICTISGTAPQEAVKTSPPSSVMAEHSMMAISRRPLFSLV